MNRRIALQLIAALGGSAAFAGMVPAYASANGATPLAPAPNGEREFDFVIDRAPFAVNGHAGTAIAINGSVPAPILRAREGETAIVRVTNRLRESTSIHWHGFLIPNDMDGVPGVTFAGIAPGETFTYRLPIRQNGTYWYHSHSGVQEQVGLYGPVVLEPANSDPVVYDREHVVLLSDWTFDDPMSLLAKLRQQGGYFNFHKETGLDSVSSPWAKMRMDPSDLSDVSSYAYSYLMNGVSPEGNWTALYAPGEKVRLRLIGAASMTIFDVRIPGLKMTVVQADGENVQPVIVDELRIAPGETYDVIVTPSDNRAYTIFAASMDRTGYARGTLAPKPGMNAIVPTLGTPRSVTMTDMGMDMSGMAMPGMKMSGEKMAATSMPMNQSGAYLPGSPPVRSTERFGIENAAVPQVTMNRLSDPGPGFEDTGRRVLVYTDLKSLAAREDAGEPTKTLTLYLTGNMERYMWSFDGKTYSEAQAFEFRRDERVRMILVNYTMMEHPIHLHGMYMELENGAGTNQPYKHTIRLKPAERLSVAITPHIPGDWALHCHLLLHMEAGMFRVVRVMA